MSGTISACILLDFSIVINEFVMIDHRTKQTAKSSCIGLDTPLFLAPDKTLLSVQLHPSTKSLVLGKGAGKVMSYEDLEQARAKRAE